MSDERRFIDFELRIEERQQEGDSARADWPPVLVGYAAVFNRSSLDLGGFTEEIAPGAFRATIAADDVRALVDHDPSRIIGRMSAGTLRLSEDEQGLRMEIDIPNTTVGRDLRESVTRGDIRGASFGFRTISDEWRMKDGLPHRILQEAKLRDVGPVTFPAYPDTQVAMRSLDSWKKTQDVSNGFTVRERVQKHAIAKSK